MDVLVVAGSVASSDNFRVINFGCRLNAYEADIIRSNLDALSSGSAGCDSVFSNCIVFNSCAVTAEAERQVRQSIRRARRDYPEHKIIVTGCGAHVSREVYAGMAEVDVIIGNDVKTDMESYRFLQDSQATESPREIGSDIMECRETSTQTYGKRLVKPQDRVRVFLEIQNGCDHRCTFCTIPYGRGSSRSLPPHEVLAQIEGLLLQGVSEIVLSGVDITAYGEDLSPSLGLGDLVIRICKSYPELLRLRLSSLDCIELDERLIGAFSDYSQIQPHIHLSLQSGNDLILKRMKRRHNREQAIELCERLRMVRPDIVFGADFIVGFPTEDESMFVDTLRLVEECGISYLHVFPYSAREGTPAARIPDQLDKHVKRDRVHRLRALGLANQRDYLRSLLGTEADILVEGNGYGYTGGYASVALPLGLGVGEVHRLRLVEMRDGDGGSPLLVAV